jgi:predicted RNase H-like HicB family nuclease
MATTDRRDASEGVRYTREEHLVTATDIETGIAASGESKSEALSELADALALHEGEGEPITDEDAFLRELDVDPDTVTDEQTPPWLE